MNKAITIHPGGRRTAALRAPRGALMMIITINNNNNNNNDNNDNDNNDNNNNNNATTATTPEANGLFALSY